jgi:hypothetical protein
MCDVLLHCVYCLCVNVCCTSVFCVLFVCKCVMYCCIVYCLCVNVYITYHITSYHIISYHIPLSTNALCCKLNTLYYCNTLNDSICCRTAMAPNNNRPNVHLSCYNWKLFVDASQQPAAIPSLLPTVKHVSRIVLSNNKLGKARIACFLSAELTKIRTVRKMCIVFVYDCFCETLLALLKHSATCLCSALSLDVSAHITRVGPVMRRQNATL